MIFARRTLTLWLAFAALTAAPSLRAAQPAAKAPDDEIHRRAAAEDNHKSDDSSAAKDSAHPKKTPVSRDPKSAEGERADDKDANAQKPADDKDADKKDADDKKDEAAKPSVTHHKVKIDGNKIAYTATAGKMLMKNDEGQPKAHVFYVAYAKDGVKRTSDRPITFVFNGGPGSSSVWLHLGMLGPRRVKLDSDAQPLPPPHQLVANPYSLLDVTDLVFIDPVSTGYSRPAKGESKNQFHGYDEDIRSVAQFIHNFVAKNNRWNSPKFLIGESYGGLRAAGLSGELQDRYHIYLNGIVLVSAVVDFQTLMAYGNNDIAYALFLPSYTATAWYHKQLSDDLQQKSVEEVVAEAEEFAMGPYLAALAAGDSLPEGRRERVARRLAELTGLSADYVRDSKLRVPMQRFGKELLRDQQKVVGRFDGRYTGLADDLVGDSADYDPSASAVFGTFTSAMNDYLRSNLKVDEDRIYEILTDHVHPWDYSEFTNRFVDASATLRQAMTENPYLKVLATCGYYDLATPELAMKYTRDHLKLAPELRDNFTMTFYEGGHMMYAHEPSLKKLRNDLLRFYEDALKPLKRETKDN